MTLWQRVTPTVIYVSLVSALFATIATFTATARLALDRISTHTTTLIAELRTGDLRTRCDSSPVGWSTPLPNGGSFATFDLARLPPPPAGPDPKLLAELREGERMEARRASTGSARTGVEHASRFRFLDETGGVLLMRLAPEGPCSLVEIRWPADPVLRGGVLLVAVLLAVLSAMVIGVLTAWRVIRPIISRVQRLHTAAAGVGRGDDYRSAADPAADELGGLSRVLDGAHERIASATRQLVERNEALQLHLADIAHDLKTPLTAVQLSLEQASRAEDGRQAQEMIAGCLDDCVYLAAMIDNLRVGTQLRDGLAPATGESRVELGEIVDHVVRRLGLLGRYKGVELNVARPSDPVWCACRALVLERVVDNLVYNAVSHGRPGDHVAVLLETPGDRFQLTVLDDGPGMSPAELESVGRRWFRGEGAELRAPRGSGLGLGIVAEVCRRWGWELRFEAAEPSGLCVTVSGPRTER